MSSPAQSCILPPDLLLALAREASPEDRGAILDTIATDHSFRLRRAELVARQELQPSAGTPGKDGKPRRLIYDQHHSTDNEPGTLVRSEGQRKVSDNSINQAYTNFGLTYKLFWNVFRRNSIDGKGMPIQGLVHYGTNYDNAFWDGIGSMYFGDGDGQLLTDTTKGLDVIGHELTHGLTQFEANLTYSGQSGALNESISDVFGSLVKQYHLKQTADKADWLIGADIVGPTLAPALRSMKAPGTANPHDKQPADMDHFVDTSGDNGGVHANSGITNHAFYVVATTLGGHAWEDSGAIWYAALCDPTLRPNATFAQFAAITLRQAQTQFGKTSPAANAVRSGWDAVKVPIGNANV